MEKSIDPIKTMLTTIKDDFLLINHSKAHQMDILPQMPERQITHFINQAANRLDYVAIQMNPSIYSKQIKEVHGKISISSNSNHVILNPKKSRLVHLIPFHVIRHLRLI